MQRLIRIISFLFLLMLVPALLLAQEESGGGMNFDITSISNIITLALTVLAGIFGTKYASAKGKGSSWMSFGQNKLSQMKALIEVLAKAIEDDKITADELAKIKESFQALVSKDSLPPPV